MKLSEIMKKYRKDNGLSTRSFAEQVGITNAYISLLENDKIKSPSIETVKNIATAMGLELDELLRMMDDMNISLKRNDSEIYKSANIDFIRIPLYKPICCGNGTFVDDNIIEYIPVPSKSMQNAEDYFCQIAIGNSMKDAGIEEGDLLVFKKADHISEGLIGCFCIDENEAVCKKFKQQNGMIILQAMNSEYEPIIVDPLNECFKCIGVLKKSIKDFGE